MNNPNATAFAAILRQRQQLQHQQQHQHEHQHQPSTYQQHTPYGQINPQHVQSMWQPPPPAGPPPGTAPTQMYPYPFNQHTHPLQPTQSQQQLYGSNSHPGSNQAYPSNCMSRGNYGQRGGARASNRGRGRGRGRSHQVQHQQSHRKSQNLAPYMPPADNTSSFAPQHHHQQQHQERLQTHQQQQQQQHQEGHQKQPQQKDQQEEQQTYHHQLQQQQQQQQRQQLWYCEPCDKEFTVLSSYEAHCATHEKCHHPNCSFVGSKKVVIAHYHSSHGQFSGSGFKLIDVEGQKFRVLLGTSPEEVQQWRQERKQRFPTQQRLQSKLQQEQALRAAGGLLHSKRAANSRVKAPAASPVAAHSAAVNDHDGSAEDTNIGGSVLGKRPAPTHAEDHSHTVKCRNVSTTQPSSNATAAPAAPESIDAAAVDTNCSQSNEMESERDVADATTTSATADANTNADAVIVDAEAPAIDVDADATGADDAGVKATKRCMYYARGKCKSGDSCRYSHSFEPQHCQFFMRGNCRNGARCYNMHDHAARNATRNNQQQQQQQQQTGSKGGSSSGSLHLPPPVSGSQLLQKLLADQIAAEESLILQCLHFIAQHDFLQT